MDLDRRQLAFLITMLTMSIVVLSLYNIHLSGNQDEDEYIVEMVMDEEEPEILEEEEAKDTQDASEAIKSHLAFNETAKPSYGNPEPLETLEELMQERSGQEDGPDDLLADSEYSDRVRKLSEKRKEATEKLGEKEAQKTEYTNYLAERRTSVSYSLVGRAGYKLPPPIYTCIEGGKVVINIEVNALGNVVDATFNEKSSNTANGCLVDNAITYALKAKFSSSDKALQKGTITYLFQQKPH